MDSDFLVEVSGQRLPCGGQWTVTSLWGSVDRDFLVKLNGPRFPCGPKWTDFLVDLIGL